MRAVECRSMLERRSVSESLCTGEMPISSRECNPQPCDAVEYTSFGCSDDMSVRCPTRVQSGGEVWVQVMQGRNLPDMDGFGAAGGETDAFVIARMDGATRRSGTVVNSNNPVWSRDAGMMYFGRRMAGEEITIELIDEDRGFTFRDDSIATLTIPVIGCSVFTGGNCFEKVWMPLGGTNCYMDDGAGSLNVSRPRTDASCLLLGVHVKAFEVVVLNDTNPNQLSWPITIDIARRFPESEDGGFIYAVGAGAAGVYRISDEDGLLDAAGGLVVKTRKEDTAYSAGNYVEIRANYPATVYVFRDPRDYPDDADPIIPNWLNSGNGWTFSTTPLLRVTGDATPRPNHHKTFPAGSITLGAPRDGLPPFAAGTTRLMYAVVVKMEPQPADPLPDPGKDFSRGVYLGLLPQFLIPWALLMAMVIPFLKRIRFRLAFIPAYLLSFTMPDVAHKEIRNINKQLGIPPVNSHTAHLLAACFRPYLGATAGANFRRNLFYLNWASSLSSSHRG